MFGADLPVEGGEAGQFVWRDGPLLKALRAGHWIVLDEVLSWRYIQWLYKIRVLSSKWSFVRVILFSIFHLARVVRSLDSAIHRIIHCSADKYQGNQLRYQRIALSTF